MPTYITLANFTDQGIRNYKDTTKRAKAFRDMVGQMAVRSKTFNGPWGPTTSWRSCKPPTTRPQRLRPRRCRRSETYDTTSLRGFGMDEIERIIKKAETGAGPFAEKHRRTFIAEQALRDPFASPRARLPARRLARSGSGSGRPAR